jgi:lipopolysaccharide transport system ATP-binding protein
MSNIAVRVENLSKLYKIGTRSNHHDTLRDHLMHGIKALFGRNGHSSVASDRLFSPNQPSLISGDLSSVNGRSDTIWALKDVSFEVKHGEVIGFIGKNGAGKTTLLKILSRITEPTSGKAKIYGRVGSLLEVGTGFHPELTGRENVYLNGAVLGLKKSEINRKFDEIVAFAEVEKFVDTPVKRYSSGMYVRLAFAVAAHLEPEILIVDEVLAVGDAAFQQKCLGKMSDVATQGRTVLFVSHDIRAISRLCNRGLVLSNGQSVCYESIEEAVERYEELVFGRKKQISVPSAPHIIYEAINGNTEEEFEITKIEILDAEGNPKDQVSTWDSFIMRVHYRASTYVSPGAVEIRIASGDSTTLLNLSTQPDSAIPMVIEVGRHAVDCCIQNFPLSAGEYFVSAALSIPNQKWLLELETLGRLTIHPRDVFNSTMPPASSRALLAVPHHWRIL